MTKESVLGPMQDRVKTDVRLPKKLAKHIEKTCEALGIQKNAFFVLAAGKLLTELGPILMPGKKRGAAVKDVDELFQKVISAAREAA